MRSFYTVCEMGFEPTPRRSRRTWGQATAVSVRDALLSSGRDLSIVSEVNSVEEQLSPTSVGQEESLTDPPRKCETPSIAWELPTRDFCRQKPDTKVVSSLSKRRNNQPRSKRNKKSVTEKSDLRGSRRGWTATTTHENNGRLTGIRSRVRGAPDSATVKSKKTSQVKHDVKKLLSTSRARQRVLKSRTEDFGKTIRVLDAKCATFRRLPGPEEAVHVDEEEACIIEVQRAAYDRWEKAVECAKQALEEVIEAEKVLGFAAEFDHLKGLMDTHGSDWDVGIDKYIDLYKNLQTEYPETAPIRRSKIVRRQPFSRSSEKKVPSRPSSPSRPSRDAPLPVRAHQRSRSSEDRTGRRSLSAIPSCLASDATAPRFDPNYILALGQRFAHSAEKWFLKLIHKLVGLEVEHSVYCREDCYRLMESLSKLQNWLLTAKGTTRMDRHDVLLNRLRDTVIRWSSQMFELPLAKTSG